MIKTQRLSFFNTAAALLALVALFSSCDKDEKPTTLELLNSSTWLGSTEVVTIKSDLEGNEIEETTEIQTDTDYHLFLLNPDKTAVVTYHCTTLSCDGDVYQGKWKLDGDQLIVTLNREQFNSIADASFIDAKIFRITESELILETNSYDPASSTKTIVRRKFVKLGS